MTVRENLLHTWRLCYQGVRLGVYDAPHVGPATWRASPKIGALAAPRRTGRSLNVEVLLQIAPRWNIAIASVLVVFSHSTMTAQTVQSNGLIRGVVVNSGSKLPIANVTIELTAPVSAAQAKSAPPLPIPGVGATTDDKGAFLVQGVRTGRYVVRLRALGYAPRELPTVSITTTARTVDLGTIALTAAAVELQSLAVVAPKREVDLAPDRNTFAVKNMPATRGGNALDVLRNVPQVDVDIDNIVSLRANSGVTMQINGRPSPMKPAQLADFLAQLSADMVDKIEVVTNPSARDDPTGVAGIINIVLKKEADAGTSGGLTVGGATTGTRTAGANIGYQRGPASFYGSYGFSRDVRPQSQDLFRENSYLAPVTFLDESVARNESRRGHTFTGSGTYLFSKRDEFTVDAVFTTRYEAQSSNILYRDLSSTRNLTALSDRSSFGTNDRTTVDAALAYKHAFAARGHKLTSEIRFDQESEAGPSDIAAHALTTGGVTSATTALENQYSVERPNEGTFKVDYVRPLPGAMRFETGYKGSLRHFNTTLNTSVFNFTQSTFLPDSERTNDFTYRELVNAGYAMLSAVQGKWHLQGGARVEQASTIFRLNRLNTNYSNSYGSFFPNALVSYNPNEMYQVKVSYSKRINRPDDTDELDPTLHYIDPLNVSRGNPYLKPEYVHSFEVGMQRTADRVTVQVTPYYKRTLDAVRTIITLDANGVATRTRLNVATADSYGADATTALKGKRLNGFVTAGAFQQVTNATALAPQLTSSGFGWRVRTNGSYHVSKSLDVQGLASYAAAVRNEQGRRGSRTQFNLAARQKLFDDQLGVTLRVIDPFNLATERSTTIDPRFFQVSDRQQHIRGLLMSFSWTFGKPSKDEETSLIDGSGNG